MAQVGRGVSLHLHVCILLSTRFFFYANLSFSYAVPLFFLCSMAQVGRGVSLRLHVSILFVDTFLFYANLSFSYAAPLFFLCSMAQVGRGVSLHLHISILFVDTFLFYANLSFSYAVPLFFSYFSTAHVGRAPLYKTRPFLVLSFMRSWLFLCCVCPFLMLHGALSIHLHVSPSISMSPSCCRHVCFLMPTGLSLMRAVSPFMPSVFFC